MNTETVGSLAPGRFAAVQNKHRNRSLIEGCRVVAVVGAVAGLLLLLACLTLPKSAVTIRTLATIAGLTFFVAAGFILYFFRDARPRPPVESGVVLSPAHGTVDYVDISTETHYLNAPARRISIYLSLLDVHVQHAPVSGSVELLRHFPGRWSRAVRRESSMQNEHLLVGLTSGDGERVAVRLISGIWVRRIVPWVSRGDRVIGGERIGLIRFGSRVDVFVPMNAQVHVKPGDKVVGGETIVARFEK